MSRVTASRPQMHRCCSGQRRQNKEHYAGPSGHHRNNDEPHAVPAGRSFDGKGDAKDEEQHRQERLKQKKNLRPSRSDICAAPERTRPADGRGHDPRLSPRGQGVPPKAQGHVSQPLQLKSKAKNSDGWNGVRVVSATLPPASAMGSLAATAAAICGV